MTPTPELVYRAKLRVAKAPSHLWGGSNKLLPCRIRIEVLANDVDYARTCVYLTFARSSLYVHDTMSAFT